MTMKMVHVGDFCPNTACADYGKLQNNQQYNIKKFGKTPAGRQRYQCKTCKRTFTETKGTLFYRLRTPEDEVVEVLALIAEGLRISSITRVKGYKEDTILHWIRTAGEHAEAVEEELLKNYQLERGQLDSLWAYVGHKGEKRLPRDRNPRPVLARHHDRHGHAPPRGARDCQNGNGSEPTGLRNATTARSSRGATSDPLRRVGWHPGSAARSVWTGSGILRARTSPHAQATAARLAVSADGQGTRERTGRRYALTGRVW